MPRITKGLYTLGDKLQQHVAVTDHSVCRARAIVVSETRWGDTSQQQIASCVLANFCENLFPQQNFVAATSRKNQIRLKLCDLLRRQIPVAATKIFTKILQCKRSVLSLQCVFATCCCNLSPSAYRPYPGFYLFLSVTDTWQNSRQNLVWEQKPYLEALSGMVFAQAQKLSRNSVNIASFCDSLVPRRSLLTRCPCEVWEDVTAHGRVQDWPHRERLGTRLILWSWVNNWVNSETDQTRSQGFSMSRREPWERGCLTDPLDHFFDL